MVHHQVAEEALDRACEQWEQSSNIADRPASNNTPCVPEVINEAVEEHREKVSLSTTPGLAMVARSLAQKEALAKPAAIAAMRKEWQSLRDKGVWFESEVGEKEDGIREASEQGVPSQFGHARCLCTEKNGELPENYPSRKVKGRVVFLGSQATNQYFETAAFADLGNSPATREAERVADFYGCCRGNMLQQADANQAYIQADTRRDPCWILLPIDAVVNKDAWRQYRQPVVRLRKAWCGHLDSVTWWDEKMRHKAQEAGFTPMGVEWPTVCLHRALRLLLAVCRRFQDGMSGTWIRAGSFSSNVWTLERSLDRVGISVVTSLSWHPNYRLALTSM